MKCTEKENKAAAVGEETEGGEDYWRLRDTKIKLGRYVNYHISNGMIGPGGF